MKQKGISSLLLCLFCLFVPSICWAEDVSIGSLADLQAFAKRVNSGNGWNSTLAAHLTADIDMGDAQDSIGCKARQYSGIFDGNGHTITYHLKTNGIQRGLFCWCNGVTIRNLHLRGTIETAFAKAAPLIGIISGGRSHISNCLIEVTINSTVKGDASIGGLIAHNNGSNTEIRNCEIRTVINGADSKNCGGVVGWNNSKQLYIYNSLIATSYGVQTTGATIARNGVQDLSDVYYVNDNGEAQGTKVDGEKITLENITEGLQGSQENDLWINNYETHSAGLKTFVKVAELKIPQANYTTYYSSVAYKLPEGLKAGYIDGTVEKSGDHGKVEVNWAYKAGDIVPAKTAVIIKSIEHVADKGYGLTLVKEDKSESPYGNRLHGSDVKCETFGDYGDSQYYALGTGDGSDSGKFGFWYQNSTGTEFNSKAHQCWLSLADNEPAKVKYIELTGETTGILHIKTNNKSQRHIYTIGGMTANDVVQKGLYIVNGKKIIIK